jgi:hypothetical protein
LIARWLALGVTVNDSSPVESIPVAFNMDEILVWEQDQSSLASSVLISLAISSATQTDAEGNFVIELPVSAEATSELDLKPRRLAVKGTLEANGVDSPAHRPHVSSAAKPLLIKGARWFACFWALRHSFPDRSSYASIVRLELPSSVALQCGRVCAIRIRRFAAALARCAEAR